MTNEQTNEPTKEEIDETKLIELTNYHGTAGSNFDRDVKFEPKMYFLDVEHKEVYSKKMGFIHKLKRVKSKSSPQVNVVTSTGMMKVISLKQLYRTMNLKW
jgi:hypothetical protein